MDIYEAIVNDHNDLRPVLQQLVDATEMNEDTQDLLVRVRDLLIPHSRAEEAIFYNSLRQMDGAKEDVRESYKEHVEAEAILRTLQAAKAINVEWTKGAQALQQGILKHMKDEETEVFGLARQYFLEEESRQMAVAFEQLKPEIKEEGFMQTTLDLISNVMPKRFAGPVKTFNQRI